MKNLKHIALFFAAVLICAGAWPLIRAGSASLSKDSNLQRPRSKPEYSKNALAVMAQGRQTLREDVDKVLKRYDTLDLEPQAIAEQVRRTGRIVLPTSSGVFDLELALHDMRAAHYRAEVSFGNGVAQPIERAPARTYKGSVRGVDRAQARITIDENSFEGVIITPSELYFVEPASRYSRAASRRDFLFYKAADVVKTSFGECGLTLAEKVGSEAGRLQSGVSAAQGINPEEVFMPPRSVELATEADFEYFTFFGNSATNANNEILSIMNQVEGIYNTQFGLQFSIVFQNVWAVMGDPYTASSAGNLLTEFTDHWNSNRGAVVRDLAHLWTDRDLDGNTIGVAWRPGFDCPFGQLGYGLSQRLSGATEKFLLTAHEIGHNFNATHTDVPTPQPGCDDTIMESSLGPSTQQMFCPFSVNEIDTHATARQACLSQALTPGCTYILSATNQSFPNTGGMGSVNVTTTGTNCAWAAGSTVDWVTINSPINNTNSGVVNFTVASNASGYARSGILRIAEQNFTVMQAGGNGCVITPISFGQTINAGLANSDCRSSQRTSSFADQYSFAGAAGRQIKIEMSATGGSGLDTYLYLIGPVTGPLGSVLTENDDIELGVQLNSRIPTNGFFTLPATGAYLIDATSFGDNETGTYSITLSDNSSSNSVSFSDAAFAVNEGVDGNGLGFEGTGLRTITVNRSGADVSGSASVDFATSEGTADERRDYTKTRGTLRFGPGETSKSFVILVTDDVFKPGDMARSRNNPNVFVVIENQNETVNLTLSNPAGTSLGPTAAAVLTINDNDAVTGANPVRNDTLNPRFFVRQQYNDFFGRDADLAGLNFWTGGITVCGGDLQCRRVKSVDTSAAFYLSIEFQETGFLVHRAYMGAFGNINAPTVPVPVTFNDFLGDIRRIGEGVIVGVGNWEQQLEANKAAYLEEFVIRPQFLNLYPLSMTPQAFVDALNAKSGGVLSQGERDTLVNELVSGQKNRGQVLRAVAEDPGMVQNEFNRSFVLMQFFGYLRRNPNDPQDTNFDGYNFWLNKLNQFNGDFRAAEMVKAFIESTEYIERFGP